MQWIGCAGPELPGDGGSWGVGAGGSGLAVRAGRGRDRVDGRREPGSAAAAEIERLRESGAEVRVALGDVGDAGAVSRLVSEADSESGLALGG